MSDNLHFLRFVARCAPFSAFSYGMAGFGLLLGLVPLALAQGDVLINPKSQDDGASGVRSYPIDLSGMVNNRGFAMSPEDADFDGLHSGYPAHNLPPENLTYAGVNYIFPQYKQSGNDNVLAQGQILYPPPGRYFSIHMLAAAETSIATGFVNVTYSDNTTSSGPVLVDPFWDWPYPYGGDIVFPGYYTNSSMDYNRSMIFQTVNWLDSTKELVSLQLPNVTAGSSTDPGGEAIDTRLHIFAATMIPATETGISLDVQYARSTKMWMEGTNKTQIFEVYINNMGDEWVLANNSVRVTVSADGLKTVVPGVINRLRPGDQAVVHVGVENSGGVALGTRGPATVNINGTGVQTSYTFDAMYGVPEYEATFDSIYSHEAAMWYNDAKYGIFIHWGPYSVPAWGNSGELENYAEWYWWRLNIPDDPTETYQYHLDTYGPDVVYDDFIANFTADAFDPKEWVDLFADAGAKYFVQVSKHHDGYAIFDLPSNVTNRTSVALPPYRNLLQEIFDAAEQYQPQMHKATYFSLPEFFSPAYAEYGFGSWCVFSSPSINLHAHSHQARRQRHQPIH